MQASLKRTIRDGREYDELFPRASGRSETVKRNANLEDTLEAIPKVVQRYDHQCAKLAKKLQGQTIRECTENIWNFCYGYIQYERDQEGTEQIRTPARAWRDRKQGIDCDCFCVFMSSTLRQMRDPRNGKQGIAHKFRVVKFYDAEDPNPSYSHIYVVVPDVEGEIRMDPVTDQFDYEVPYMKKREINMELQVLNGLGPGATTASPGPLEGIDQAELFNLGLYGLEGKEALKPPPAPPPPTVSVKLERIKNEAAARGMTIPQYRAYVRQEFIRKHGKTPEQWAAEIRAKNQASNQAGAAREAEQRAKLKRELDKRGIAYSRNATKQELLDLLRANPAQGTGGRMANAFNKANPAAVLLRTGVRILLLKNFLHISSKLRYGFLTESQARAQGIDRGKHRKLAKVVAKLRSIYFKAGGKSAKFKAAILQGKGNRDRAVSLSGMEAAGLGEPISASAAIAAASATMAAIAALLKSIGNLKSSKPGDPAPNERGSGGTQEPGKAENFLNNLSNLTSSAGSAIDNFTQIKNGGKPGGEIVQLDRNTPGGIVPDNAGYETPAFEEDPDDEKSASTAKKGDKLIKGLMIGSGVLAAVGVGYWLISSKPKTKTTLAGHSKKPASRTKKTQARSRKGTTTKKPVSANMKMINIP